MIPTEAVLLIDCLSNYLKDNGYIVFTLKMTNRGQSKKEIEADVLYCVRILSDSFENVKVHHLFTDKSNERTLTASKKHDIDHHIHSNQNLKLCQIC